MYKFCTKTETCHLFRAEKRWNSLDNYNPLVFPYFVSCLLPEQQLQAEAALTPSWRCATFLFLLLFTKLPVRTKSFPLVIHMQIQISQWTYSGENEPHCVLKQQLCFRFEVSLLSRNVCVAIMKNTLLKICQSAEASCYVLGKSHRRLLVQQTSLLCNKSRWVHFGGALCICDMFTLNMELDRADR